MPTRETVRRPCMKMTRVGGRRARIPRKPLRPTCTLADHTDEPRLICIRTFAAQPTHYDIIRISR